MKQQSHSRISTRILIGTASGAIILALLLVATMVYFLNSLTDATLLNTQRAVAKTAAKGAEENLHIMADRMLMLRNANDFNKGTLEHRQFLLEMAHQGVEFVWLALYDVDGLWEVGTADSPEDIGRWDLYDSLRETDNLSIADTMRTINGLEIVVGLPVFDSLGRVAHYLLGSYKYDVLNDVLSGTKLGAASATYIINADMRIMAHQDTINVLNYSDIWRKFSDIEVFREVWAEMSLGQIGAMKLDAKEGTIYLCYAPVRGTNWSLIIEAAKSDFSAPTKQAILISVSLTIVLLVSFALILFNILRRTFTRPLEVITENAARLAAGHLIHTIPEAITKRRDEIGQFGRAFLGLSDSVSGMLGNIAEITRSASAGKLYDRADAARYHGDYQRIVAGANAMLDVFCAHLDAMPDAIALLDENALLVYYNHTMSQLLRRHEIAPDDSGLMRQLIGRDAPHVTLMDVFTQDVTLESIDDDPRHYTLALRLLATGGYILIMNDVTQLARARIEAEAANRAKSEFLSRMSHELLTPMNAIVGSTKLARGTSDLDRVYAYLDKSGVASAHLLGVVNDILDYSDIESGRMTLTPDDFALAEDVAAIVTDTRLTRGVTIETDVRVTHGVVTTDSARLNQVLTNLLSNAVKFSKEDGVVRLEITEEDRDDDGLTLFAFTVADRGVGIARDARDKLFRPFEQADSGLARSYGGTGLGLVICKHIVEMMGGGINFESAPSEGTTFRFTIRVPAREADDEAIGANLAGKRCLVVDDVDVNREILAALLEDTGILIEMAENGQQAVDAFTASPVGHYDVILMDMQMPVMDGCAATEAIRALPRRDALVTPIIALTANITHDDIERAKAAGMDAHLSKPVELSATLTAMSRLIAKRENAEA